MNIESLVCSLENSKKLKELGVKKHSYFYYNNNILLPKTACCICNPPAINTGNDDYYSAYTAQELLDLIDVRLEILTNKNKVIHVYYQPENGTDNSYGFNGENLADLLAQVLIAQIGEGEFNNEV